MFETIHEPQFRRTWSPNNREEVSLFFERAYAICFDRPPCRACGHKISNLRMRDAGRQLQSALES